MAQNDQDLNAEWGLSSFDRRHQLAADTSIELPFGPNRPWLNGGGTWAALFRDWRLTTTFTWQSGTPLTARVLASVGDALRGTNGTLRADYNGDKIQVAGPDDRRVLQHVSVFEARARIVRQFAAKPDHRAGHPPVERTVLAGRPDGRQPRHHAPVERDEPAEHGELRDRGYGRELADIRPGPLRAADAFDAVHDEVSILEEGSSEVSRGARFEVRKRRVRVRDLMTTRFWNRPAAMATVAFVVTTALSAQQAAQAPPQGQTAQPNPQAPQPVFRSRREVITVDAIVRDKSGAIARGLTAADFEIREDGRPQDVLNFSFEEIRDKAPAKIETADLLAGVEARLQEQTHSSASAAAAPGCAAPLTSESMAGRRLITLLFDVSSMQPDDVQRAVDSAQKYVSEKMSAADLVAVVTVSSTLSVLTDFTADRGKVAAALTTLGYAEGTATPPPDASTAATDEAAAAATDDATAETSDLDHLQQRHPAARAQDTRGHPRAHRAEEIHHLLQRGHAAERPGQSGGAPRRHQFGRPRERVFLSDRHARAAGGRARRRCEAGERAGQLDVLGPRCRAAVRHARRLARYADVACRRHRRPGIHRHQRLWRGVRARAERHVRLLPAGLQQLQPGPRRSISAHPGPRQTRRLQSGGSKRLLRRPRFRPHQPWRSRDAVAGSALLRSVSDRPTGDGNGGVVQAVG